MKGKAFLAICIAIIIPVAGYYLLKNASDKTVQMPKRLYWDSVINKIDNGKMSTDTVWHRTENFTLINQLGDTIRLDSIKNKIIVADFFFTHCPSICPTLTKNMKKLQQAFIKGGDPMQAVDSSIVLFLSFSVDPERDSVPVLKKYADHFGVNSDNWWLLTGSKKTIYDLALNEFKLGIVDGEGVDSAFVHTQKLVLLDKDHIVRGRLGPQVYYDGLDTTTFPELAKDIGLLMMEKPLAPEAPPFDPVQMAIFFGIALIAVIFAVNYLIKKKKQSGDA